jgi:ribulose-phosphate 3-epimerase
MSVVIPAILVPSEEALRSALTRLTGLTDTVQLDVVDGHFAAPATWPYTNKTFALPEKPGFLTSLGNFQYEIDLMVEAPETQVGAWIAAGANRIVVHIESTRYLAALIENLTRTYGYEKGFAPNLLSLGVALNVDTDLRVLEPYLDAIDYVQFMGIRRIGIQGEPFDARVLRTIANFRNTHPDIPIQVDGAVSEATAPALLAAGVDRLCVGSALFKAPDLAHALKRLEALGDSYGRYV